MDGEWTAAEVKLRHYKKWLIDREEKSLRHVAIAAKFLDENKLRTSLNSLNSHCFKRHCSYSVSFNLSNVGEIFWG